MGTPTKNAEACGAPVLAGAPLGQAVRYPEHYCPSLLFAVPRQAKREELGLQAGAPLPFFGVDVWHAYEISWLDARGKPVVALGRFAVPADSPCLIESKSLKLYLNSLNQTNFPDARAVAQTLTADLSGAAGAPVQVAIWPLRDLPERRFAALPEGVCLDALEIDVDVYDAPRAAFLRVRENAPEVSETLYSQLLKSNCLITQQPDWGTLVVRYRGQPIERESLLRYVISFRQHCEFHEQCVERIFCDIQRRCAPRELTVYARYTRRGGLDINPLRSDRAGFVFPHEDDIRQ